MGFEFVSCEEKRREARLADLNALADQFKEMNDHLRDVFRSMNPSYVIWSFGEDEANQELMDLLLDLYKTRPAGFHHVETRCDGNRNDFTKEVIDIYTKLKILEPTIFTKKLKLKAKKRRNNDDAAVLLKLERRIEALEEEEKQLKWCVEMATCVVSRWNNGVVETYVDELQYKVPLNAYFYNKYVARERERQVLQETVRKELRTLIRLKIDRFKKAREKTREDTPSGGTLQKQDQGEHSRNRNSPEDTGTAM